MDADDLYGLALDEFVRARGALAKELRKAGQRDEATAVGQLRRPSIAAWSVNQLIRTQRAAVEELFEAGDALRDAQSDLLAGRGDARGLRAAGDRERAAVDALVDRARGLLSSAGTELSATIIDRVSDTLHAAALDGDAREQVRHGRLERELRHVGLGFGLGEGESSATPPSARSDRAAAGERAAGTTARSDPAPRHRTTKDVGAREAGEGAGASKSSAAERRAERERATEQSAEAERLRRERAAARRDARAAHATARRRADAAARVLQAAEERRDQAAQELHESEAAVAAARADADDAGAALQRAEADVAAAERAS